jgi:hypothetical protein
MSAPGGTGRKGVEKPFGKWTHLGNKRSILLRSSTVLAQQCARVWSPALGKKLMRKAQKDGKLRVNYQGWEDTKVALPGEWI